MERRVKRGHRIHLMHRIQKRKIMETILMGVARQQGTTVAILVHGQTDSGAIQLIQTRDGNLATFRSAVNVSLYIFSISNFFTFLGHPTLVEKSYFYRLTCLILNVPEGRSAPVNQTYISDWVLGVARNIYSNILPSPYLIIQRVI